MKQDRVRLIVVTDPCGEITYDVEWIGDNGEKCGASFYGFGAEHRTRDYQEAVEFHMEHGGVFHNPLLQYCAEGDVSCLKHKRRNCPECQELGNEG